MTGGDQGTLFAPLGERVYAADGIELWHGNCLDVMPGLPPVDAIVADLPFATTRNHWDRLIDPKLLWHAYRRLMTDRTPVVLFGSGIFTHRTVMSQPDAWRYNLVWDKQAITGHLNAKRRPLVGHEDLIVFYDRQPTYNPQMVDTGRRSHSRGSKRERTTNHWGGHDNTPVPEDQQGQYPRSILRFPRPKGRHPSQKPVALLEWLIRTYTNEGDLVLDNVAGSASTLVAARNCGRRAIGIELHGPYVEMAVERLESGSTGDRWS